MATRHASRTHPHNEGIARGAPRDDGGVRGIVEHGKQLLDKVAGTRLLARLSAAFPRRLVVIGKVVIEADGGVDKGGVLVGMLSVCLVAVKLVFKLDPLVAGSSGAGCCKAGGMVLLLLLRVDGLLVVDGEVLVLEAGRKHGWLRPRLHVLGGKGARRKLRERATGLLCIGVGLWVGLPAGMLCLVVGVLLLLLLLLRVMVVLVVILLL